MRKLSILLIFLLTVATSQAQSPAEQSAEAFLMGYINALNTQDYATAYNMMDNRNDSYEDFVAGYEHTVRIVPYFGFGGAAAGSTYVTTVLLGYQDDGTIESYYGYFQLHSGQLYSPVRNNGGWVLSRGHFRLISDSATAVLPNVVIEELLQSAWDETIFLTPELVSIAEANNEPSLVLMSYYDHINMGLFTNAYNMWLSRGQGPSQSYALPYADFVAGYNDTDYVTVYTGGLQAPLAGSYLLGYLPTILVSEHTDGSFETFSGCYALARVSTGGIGIVNGRFSLLKDDAPSSDEIFDALDTLNCSSLNIPVA